MSPFAQNGEVFVPRVSACLNEALVAGCKLNEAALKKFVKAMLPAVLATDGFVVDETERTIRPEEWPRVGPVDIAVSRWPLPGAEQGAPTHLFAELKWGAKDGLWNCVWDIAKSALVERLGVTDHALLVVGFTDREWEHAKYGALLEPRHWETAAFQRRDASEWRYWARPPTNSERHRAGPYRLPRVFSTALLDRLGFRLGGHAWSLGMVAIQAETDLWIELDYYAQPLP